MRSTLRHQPSTAAPTRRRRAGRGGFTLRTRGGRGGFTLVEMMVSVTLVLLMMLMFAEIYGLAQNTISTQQGIAENDQKARILSQVLRRDLETRTFRSVYPFRYEDSNNFAITAEERELLERRKGYFSFSENDPDIDTDDVLQLTVAVDQKRWGQPGERLYGKATQLQNLTNGEVDGPEFDDGRLGDSAGASGTAEVSYFLRNGNLYRSVLLVRQPYLKNDSTPGYVSPGNATPTGFSGARPQFWNDFDYSAYRWPNSSFSNYELHFHGQNSLENDPQKNLPRPYIMASANEVLWVPKALSSPFLRFGHLAYRNPNDELPWNQNDNLPWPKPFPSGMPLEFSRKIPSAEIPSDSENVIGKARTDFFGRFTTAERSDSSFEFPGVVPNPPNPNGGWTPFDGIVGNYPNGTRRGVDLMLPNVHAFDVEMWDDALGEFVDLGHEKTLPDNSNKQVPAGYYNRNRLRKNKKTDGSNVVGNEHSSAPVDFGNRYDTWGPRFFVGDAAGTPLATMGRAPYRPEAGNPDPNVEGFTGVPFGSPDEAPLRAIRIKIRYLDVNSGQLRQTTIEESLID